MGIRLRDGLDEKIVEYTITKGQAINCNNKIDSNTYRGDYAPAEFNDYGCIDFAAYSSTPTISGYYIDKILIPDYSFLLYAEITVDDVTCRYRIFNKTHEPNSRGTIMYGLAVYTSPGNYEDSIMLDENIYLGVAFNEPEGIGAAELLVGLSYNNPYSGISMHDVTIRLHYI